LCAALAASLQARHNAYMPTRFDPAALALFDRVREVDIQTTSIDGAEVHRTTIWIVTVDGRAFIRSEYAERGRWYREARHLAEVVLRVEGAALPVTAVLVEDPDTIEAVSAALDAKYRKISSASTDAMIAPHTLPTTLRLDPR
jgi:hypothetical protein